MHLLSNHSTASLRLTLSVALAAFAWASGAELAPLLPVVTGGVANSLIRSYDPDDRESLLNRTYVQNYTSMLAVAPDGFIYTNTSWEEGHRPAGTYRNGDCLPDHAGFGTGSGWTVAVGERLVIYGHWGKVVIIERKPGQALDGEGGKTRREIVVSPEAKPLQITGLALDEAKGRIWVATGDHGRVRCFALRGRRREFLYRRQSGGQRHGASRPVDGGDDHRIRAAWLA